MNVTGVLVTGGPEVHGSGQTAKKPTYVEQFNTTRAARSSLEAKLWVQLAANTLLALLSVMPIFIACLAIEFTQMRFLHIK